MEAVSQTLANFLGSGATWVVRMFLAILVLLVGILIAKVISKIVGQILLTADVDERVGRWIGLELLEGRDKARKQVASVLENVAYYLLLVIFVIFALEVLGDRTISMVLQNILNEMGLAIPRILKAMLILAGAWLLALLAKFATIRTLRKFDLDKRLKAAAVGEAEAETEPPSGPGTPEAMGTFVFYFILLFALLPFLDALGLQALVDPLKGMFAKALGYVPNVLTAALVLLLGYFVAKVCQRLAESFARAAGFDRAVSGLRFESVLKSLDVPRFVGTVVFVAVLIPVLATVFDILDLPVLSGAFGVMLNQVAASVPRILAAFLLLVLGLVLGRYLGDVATQMLKEMGFDLILGRIGLSKFEKRGEGEGEPGFQLSSVAGNLVMAVVVLFFIMEGFRMMRLDLMADAVDRLILFLPNVLVAFVILGLGFYLAKVLESMAARSFAGEPTLEAGLVGLVLRYSVIVFAFFMAFDQLGIAHSIVVSAFAILLGTVGLGLALAFGLGAKEHARDYISHLKERRAVLREEAEGARTGKAGNRESGEPGKT
jgi:small-conductance mechanosensitive channel